MPATPALEPTTPTPPTSPESPPYQIHLNDDVFHSSSRPSSPYLTANTTLLPTTPDLIKLHSQHSTLGYRAAISVSKNKYIQIGFDRGYEFGGKVGLVVGWVRGVAEGLVHVAAGGEREREMKGMLKELEMELAVEKVLGREWIDEEGMWKWNIGTWDRDQDEGAGGQRGQAKGREEEGVDLDLVVQSHPVIRKWVNKVTEMARNLGLDIHGSNEEGSQETNFDPKEVANSEAGIDGAMRV